MSRGSLAAGTGAFSQGHALLGAQSLGSRGWVSHLHPVV